MPLVPKRMWQRLSLILSLALLIAFFVLFFDTSACPVPSREGSCPAVSVEALENLPAGAPFSLRIAPAQAESALACLVANPTHAALDEIHLDIQGSEMLIHARLRRVFQWPVCISSRWELHCDAALPTTRWACTHLSIGRLPMPAFVRSLLSAQVDAIWEGEIFPPGLWELEEVRLSEGFLILRGRRR